MGPNPLSWPFNPLRMEAPKVMEHLISVLSIYTFACAREPTCYGFYRLKSRWPVVLHTSKNGHYFEITFLPIGSMSI